LKAKERVAGMRCVLSNLPQDFISSRHSLFSKAPHAPPPNCEAVAWKDWVTDLPKEKKLRRYFMSLTGNLALCFDPDVDFPWQEYPSTLGRLSEMLPALWKGLLSPLPVFNPPSTDLLPAGPDLDDLGEQEALAENMGEAVDLVAEEAENERLRLAIASRKRLRDEVSDAASRASAEKRARLLEERRALISEMEALDAEDVERSQQISSPDSEVVALRKQVKSLSSILASSGSTVPSFPGAHSAALAVATVGGVHPWAKHAGLKAVGALSSTALAAQLQDAPSGHNRGELAPELDKPRSWTAGFSREVHQVTQRPFPPQVLKDFAGGRFNLTAIGYFLPFGLESRDRALQDFSDRPMAVDVFQSLLDGEGGDVNGLRTRSGSSPSSMQPANLLDFATAVVAFGRLLYLLRSPEESASFQRFVPIFLNLLTGFPHVPVASFVAQWSSYIQDTMRLVYEVEFLGALANRYDWDSSERISSLKFRVEMANEQAKSARLLRHQQESQQKDRHKKAEGDASRTAGKAQARAAAWRQQGGDESGSGNGGRGGNGNGRSNGGGGRGGRANGGGRGEGPARTQSGDPSEAGDGAATPTVAADGGSAAPKRLCQWNERCFRISSGCPFRHTA
jgi:uncharacterized membrane protein YgcG